MIGCISGKGHPRTQAWTSNVTKVVLEQNEKDLSAVHSHPFISYCSVLDENLHVKCPTVLISLFRPGTPQERGHLLTSNENCRKIMPGIGRFP